MCPLKDVMMSEKINIPLLEVKINMDQWVITETLTRIGIPKRSEQTLYPSCYLYSKNDRYYIVHFKELFLIRNDNNSYNNMSDEDIKRKESIARALETWGMVNIISDLTYDKSETKLFVLPFREKGFWKIVHKFNHSTIQDL